MATLKEQPIFGVSGFLISQFGGEITSDACKKMGNP